MSVGTRGRQQARGGGGNGVQGREGSWYRGWRWRWQSQCPTARTGSRRVAANDPRQFFTLHRASRRAKRAEGGGTRGRGPMREEARRGEDSRWKADERRWYGKGENEMKSVFSGSSSRVRAARTRCTLGATSSLSFRARARSSRARDCSYLRERPSSPATFLFCFLSLLTFFLCIGMLHVVSCETSLCFGE